MDHILDHLKRDTGPEDKWAIVGKGPKTFSCEKVVELKKSGYRLCSINETYLALEGLGFDLCVFNDWQVAAKLSRLTDVRAFATTTQAHHWVPEAYKSLPGLLDCMATFLDLNRLGKLYSYDTLGSKVFPAHPSIFTCTSSSESAFDILCRAGVREFAFVGIDGGRGYHPSFKSPTSNDLTGQFRGLARLARIHNIDRISGVSQETWERYFKSSGVGPK